MKVLSKLFVLTLLVGSLSVFSIGCTGPNAVEGEGDDGTPGEMTDEDYEKEMQGDQTPPADADMQ